MECCSRKHIDVYKEKIKKKIYFNAFFTMILLFVILVFLQKDWIILIVMALLCFLIEMLFQIYCYVRINKIKKYMNTNNISIEDEKILFWNKGDFLLTESYVFIIKNRKIKCFKYKDIVKIQKYECYKTGSTVGGSLGTSLDVKLYKYLYISFDDCTTYKILTYKETSFEEEDIDVASILLEKNPQIQKEEDIAESWYYAYKRR